MVSRCSPIALALAFAALPALAQNSQFVENQYEARFGVPVDVTISDLTQNPPSYDGRAVRTRGRLMVDAAQGQRVLFLQDTFSARVYVQAISEVAGEWDSESLKLLGSNVEFTGVFRASGTEGFGSNTVVGVLQFWQFVEENESQHDKAAVDAKIVSLEELVTHPGKLDGRTVRVVGQFRGRNLFGDLPSSSEQSHADWVIKDDLFAVWVTGKKPKGSGWQLDAGLKRDSGHWLEVVGRVESRNGFVYIRARSVEQGKAPTPTAAAEAPAPPPPRPKVPPVVVFQLPLDGETDVPAQSRFVVQFSKDMDEASFKGHVLLRYVGGVRPGDRDFDGVTMSYDGGRRALTVDPGDLLRQGRRIELLLLPGIIDIDGLPLAPRPGQRVGVAVDRLRYTVAGG
jgi:Bacterial Ig-like domain